jgi:hypothetical protein
MVHAADRFPPPAFPPFLSVRIGILRSRSSSSLPIATRSSISAVAPSTMSLCVTQTYVHPRLTLSRPPSFSRSSRLSGLFGRSTTGRSTTSRRPSTRKLLDMMWSLTRMTMRTMGRRRVQLGRGKERRSPREGRRLLGQPLLRPNEFVSSLASLSSPLAATDSPSIRLCSANPPSRRNKTPLPLPPTPDRTASPRSSPKSPLPLPPSLSNYPTPTTTTVDMMLPLLVARMAAIGCSSSRTEEGGVDRR